MVLWLSLLDAKGGLPFTTTPGLNDPRGAQWRRWDLHVHTPKSLEQAYGGDTPQAWERFLVDLENLPPEFKALGINDYLFIDGYERLLDEKARGRLANIDLLLPVVELRLDKFGGTESQLRRVNFHVIFSSDLSPAEIRSQFLNLLKADYTVGERFNKAINIDTLRELGQHIIETTPTARRTNADALTVGFNNLNFPLNEIEHLLANTTFTNRHLTAVGKAEWADVKWQQSVADKRTIIERADFVFIAAASSDHCLRARQALMEAEVNSRLLDCSDAHHFANSAEKERIGHCYTWIKADTTFDGLRQVRQAYDERVYLGEMPPKLALVAAHPTKFIDSLEVRRKTNATLAEVWFDNLITLNPDLVAIIGNKGMGKSALTDILALTSNADAPQEKYGFLTENRFRDRRDNKAKHFNATIAWTSGAALTRGLEESVPAGTIPQVRYIPQNYFEELCNETTNPDLLQRELRGVIFRNLTPAQRGRFRDLDELIAMHTREAERRIDELRAELHTINREIVQLEHELSANRRKQLEDALQNQEAALTAHEHAKPEAVSAPAQQTSTPDLESAKAAADAVEKQITQVRRELLGLHDSRTLVANLYQRFLGLQETISKLQKSTAGDLLQLGITFEELLPVSVDFRPLERRHAELDSKIETAEIRLNGKDGLVQEGAALRERVRALRDALDAPARMYQQYLEAQTQWEQQRAMLIGTSEAPGSLEYLKTRLTTTRDEQAERLANLNAERIKTARAIHEQQLGITSFERTLYAPVADRLSRHPVVREQLNVNFMARLVDAGLEQKFLKRINRARIGVFSEEHAMRDLLLTIDLNETDQIEHLLATVVECLHRNAHGETSDIDDLRRQLRKDEEPEELYNFLFGLEYLEPRYALRINDRELAQLTPGERGSLLLVFYLVIDQDDRPLIIDQPEENLDNQSVFELLVPCIREAKERRQIIVVTHNPNLAVVCNAEQIICSRINKDTDQAVTYTSGSIENPVINRHLVDVLEGTWPAFTDRGRKYHDQPQIRMLPVYGAVLGDTKKGQEGKH